MSRQNFINDESPDPGQAALAEELLSNQLALIQNVTNTSHLLKTTLTAARANLALIQAQLAKIQELAAAIEN